MTLTIVFVVVFLICLAMLWNEGMWSNALTVINVTFSAMLATNYYELLATWLDGQMPSYTYLIDFLCLWFLFALSYALLRALTDQLSTTQVRFKMPVEHTGRVVFAAMAGWIFICFMCMTLHTAPIARTAFRGSFQNEPQSNHFLGFAPDRMWLGFMQSRSQNALSQPDSTARGAEPIDQGKRVFDPHSEFALKYGARRLRLQQQMQKTGSMRVGAR